MRTGLAMALLLVAPVSSADDLGTLFTNESQRQRLEGELHHRTGAPRKPVLFQGIVSRRGGGTFAWFDDTPLQRGNRGEGFTVLDAGPEGAVILREEAPAADDEGGAP